MDLLTGAAHPTPRPWGLALGVPGWPHPLGAPRSRKPGGVIWAWRRPRPTSVAAVLRGWRNRDAAQERSRSQAAPDGAGEL